MGTKTHKPAAMAILAVGLPAVMLLVGACATVGLPGVESAGSLTHSDAPSAPTPRMGVDPSSGAVGPWCPPDPFGPYSAVYCGPGIPPRHSSRP
jgi:hypothetical protein